MGTKLLRLPDVLSATGYSRSSIYLMIHQGLWPRQVNLGSRSVAWPESEVSALIDARIAGKSEEEIRELVASLEQRRAAA
jgi:prophage regulatory protein